MKWAEARVKAMGGQFVKRAAWTDRVLTYEAGLGTTRAVAVIYQRSSVSSGTGITTTTSRRVALNSDFGKLDHEADDWATAGAPGV